MYHDLNPPIKARYIRFRPVAWNFQMAMRVELYGCSGEWSNFLLVLFCFVLKILSAVGVVLLSIHPEVEMRTDKHFFFQFSTFLWIFIRNTMHRIKWYTLVVRAISFAIMFLFLFFARVLNGFWNKFPPAILSTAFSCFKLRMHCLGTRHLRSSESTQEVRNCILLKLTTCQEFTELNSARYNMN